jgi:hypothetical protein
MKDQKMDSKFSLENLNSNFSNILNKDQAILGEVNDTTKLQSQRDSEY